MDQSTGAHGFLIYSGTLLEEMTNKDQDILVADKIPPAGNPATETLECLYDKYSGIIYHAIFSMTEDDCIAEEILTQVFIEINKGGNFNLLAEPQCKTLLALARVNTRKYLKRRNIAPVDNKLQGTQYPIIHLLMFETRSIANAAKICGISLSEARSNLRHEFANLLHRFPA